MTTAALQPVLYVAWSPKTNAVRWFEVNGEDADDLADDLTQVDADDIRRAYRRLDGMWFAFLHTRALPEQWAPIRARMIELRGEGLIAKAEAFVVSSDYQTPRISR